MNTLNNLQILPKELENIIKDYIDDLEETECWLCQKYELDCECICFVGF